MKTIKLLTLATLVMGVLSSTAALAGPGHWHSSIGIYVGPGFGPYYGRPYYPPYYADPYYYAYPYPYPPVVVAPPVVQSPPVYIEQPQAAPQQAAPQQSAAQDNYWYHCDKPEGYYPYVKECPAGWQRVSPEPPK